MKVDRAQVVGFRSAQQHLGRRTDLGTAAGTASQNTPPGSAQLALRVRADVTSEDVARAIEQERSLVQVWSLRGSPCIVTAAEFPLFTVGLLPDDEESWQAVTQGFLPVIKQLSRSATETMELVIEATRDALDGAVLTKRELGAALGKRLPPGFGPSLHLRWSARPRSTRHALGPGHPRPAHTAPNPTPIGADPGGLVRFLIGTPP